MQRHGNAAFRCAVAEMQGWRVGHEDAHAMRCDASSATCFVLDGHGGDGAALFSAPELLEEVSKREKAPDVPSDAHLEEAFSTVDKRLRGYFQEHAEKDSGTTVVGAVCAKTKDGSYKVKLLNCGDSRALVVRNPKEEACPEPLIRRPGHIEALGTKGNPVKGETQVAAPTGKPLVVVETVDHKPDHPTEKGRIEAAGGSVSFEDPPRLDGSLAVSRGLGDFEYKADGQKPVGEQQGVLYPGHLRSFSCDAWKSVYPGL